jgi:hypothetical protein
MVMFSTDICVLILDNRDKRQFSKILPQIDPVLYTLTEGSKFIQRKPDATFGLTTFFDCESDLSVYANELRRTRPEKLLLHCKCALLADPKWGETDLAFPFAVYGAKGWSGDCREARYQACLAGATYLDMLDDLARCTQARPDWLDQAIPGIDQPLLSGFRSDVLRRTLAPLGWLPASSARR